MRKAKSDLSKLIEAALNGEKVVITNRGKPSVRLVPEAPKSAKNRGIGCLKGKVTLPEDWDSVEREAEFTALFQNEARRKHALWEKLLEKRSKKSTKRFCQ